jgi:UDP-glucose 4-epimerase
VLALRAAGWRVVAGVRRDVKSQDENIVCVRGELTEPDYFARLRAAAESLDAFFHLGAALPPQAGPELLEINAISTARLLEQSADWGEFALVFASSISVIGKPEILPVSETHPVAPNNLYSISKLCAELACEAERKARDRRIASLRFTSIYGAGMPTTTILPRFIARALRGDDLCWLGDGARTQNFLHANDAARACLLAAENDARGVFNIGSERAISMRELAEMVQKLTSGCRSALRSLDQPDPQADFRWDIDLVKARRELGFASKVPMAEGVRECIESTAGTAPAPRWWSLPA